MRKSSSGSLHPISARATSSSQSIISIIQLSFTPTHSRLAGRHIMDLHGGLGDDSLCQIVMTMEIMTNAATVVTLY